MTNNRFFNFDTNMLQKSFKSNGFTGTGFEIVLKFSGFFLGFYRNI